MHYKEYTERAYEIACRHGFHDKDQPLAHWLMLVITEVSEMVEADRKSKRAQVAMFKRESVSPQPKDRVKSHWQFCFEQFIKDTVEDEMADVCIRLFDLAGNERCEIHEVNYTEWRFGEMRQMFMNNDFPVKAYELCLILVERGMYPGTLEMVISSAISFLCYWAKTENIDLEWHINQKMKYNDMRSRLHGKKY